MKHILLSLLIGLSIHSFAQKASPYICNYTLPDSLQQELWSISQSQSGSMFVAGSRGLLQFDGKHWQRIVLPSMPTALACSNEGDAVWIGCKNNLGLLKRNQFGIYNYKSYLATPKTEFSIENIVTIGQYTYFISDKQIFVVEFQKAKVIGTIETHNQITAAFPVGNLLGVYTENKGLQLAEGAILHDVVLNINNNAIIAGCTLGKKTILGLASNSLQLFDGKTATPFLPALNSFLNENVLHDIAIDSSGNIIISTLIGGVAIVDSKTGTIKTILNYSNGLPDNEIYALHVDQTNGIWVAHEKGLSRIDLSLPVQRFDIFEGLSGTILASAKFNNVLYVATSEGVYYLTQTEVVHEVEIAKPVEQIHYETVKKEVEQTSRSFLLFRKREKVEQTETRKVSQIVLQKVKVTKREPGAWVYKKVEGISGKCKQLVATGYGLLVASNNGVYEIKGTSASPVIAGKYVTQIESSQFHAHYFCLTDDGIFLLKLNNGEWSNSRIFTKLSQKINSLAEVSDNELWLTSNNQAYHANIGKDTSIKTYTIGSRFYPQVDVRLLGKTTVFIADNETFQWNGSAIVPFHADRAVASGLAVWLKQNGQWIAFEGTKHDTCNWIGLFNPKSIFTDANGLHWVVDGQKGLYCINPKTKIKTKTLLLEIITQKTGDTSFLPLGDIELPAKSGNLLFGYTLPSFLQTETEYQYFIEGLSIDWSAWQTVSELRLNFLPHGSYTLHLRARDGIGNQTSEISVSFSVPTPLTQSVWFYIAISLGCGLVSFIVFKWRMRKLKHDNEVLENKVRERTKTIEEQKEEITAQLEEILQNKEEIEAQRDEIEAQRDTIFEQKDEIIKSITYAQRIQHAVMPTGDWLKSLFTDYYVLYQPRDIVSGDFYWMVQIGKKVIIAAADCTGHGVPGAFMSMLGVSFMNEIVLKNQLTHSDEIANQLRETVIKTLSQTEGNQQAKDGMDMALCVFDFERNIVQFTGAYNPLLLIRNGEITEFAANRMPIGRFEKNDLFTAQEIPFLKGDQFYLFSDGFEDQFGGPAQKKLKKVRFKEWLLQYSSVSLPQQKAALHKNFEQWKSDTEQTDDVLVIGLKI